MPAPRSWRFRLWFIPLLAMFAYVALPADSFARSSGGYSRSGPSGRTPSFGGGGGYRTPSTSGGYSRPSESYARPPAYAAPQSPGDRSFSEGRSGAALDSYRTQQDNARRPREYAPSPSRGWSTPPQTSFGGNRSFGAWNGFFLGALLSNLGRPGSGDWFHNNQNDPGYRQWRAEADRQAQTNPELSGKLNELDRQLAERDSQPRTPGTLPPDIPPDVAKAVPTRTPSIATPGVGSAWVWVVLAGGGAGIAYLAWQRHRPATGGPSVTSPSTSPLGVVGSLLRHKLSGEGYTPSKFRVGMTLALDPTPFILAAGSIKLPQPDSGSGSGQVSVSAVGRVVAGNTQLVRLYLPDDRSLVQLHLDPAGDPDECRLFGTIDEITPADPSEWGAWLDPNEGMIGWPTFQTKDGKTYSRVWAPGDTRISPRVLTETVEGLSGTRTVQSQAMLYAAPTGGTDPAPTTEYIMVAALQVGGRAWVEIRAGIDLNPVTLQLA
ncbi:MAG: DUF2491 family protein [Rhodospirillales bacterium]|nr:DUF2491 family protein [Rhodospirillales bacterium]